MSTHEDDRLRELLAEAMDLADPVPEHVVAAAKEAYTWRTIDAELAELVYDSASQEPVGVRGEAAARQVTFRAPGVEIEIMVMSAETRRLVGQLVPPQQATVQLRHGDSVREVDSDNLGRFSFTDVTTGAVQVVVVTPEGNRVVTEWTVL